MKKNLTLIGFSFLISKVLGLVRDNLLAGSFGASSGTGLFNLDTYYAAFRLPDLLFNLLSYGVLSAAFVPLFMEILKKESREKAFHFANEILHTLSFIILGISIILFLLAPYLLKLFVPGFPPEDLQITVTATRIMLLTPFFFTVSGIAAGVQNAFGKFFSLSVAPILYNLGIIGGIVLCKESYGVYGVAFGVSAGAFLHMAVQLPGLLRTGFRFQTPLSLWSARVKEMLTLALPRILGMSATQLSLAINTVIASTLSAGSIAILNFSSNLESLPVGLIGISVAVVSFTKLSEYTATNNMPAFKNEISNNLRRILFLLIPGAVGIFLLRFELVSLLLGRGKFGEADIVLTANTLGILAPGIIFGGTVFLLARSFYALKNTKTPVAVGMLAVLSNLVIGGVAAKVLNLGVYGLALGTSLANVINATLLFFFLQHKLKEKLLRVSELFKFVIATLVMSASVELIKFIRIDSHFKTLGAILIGAIVYGGICILLRCRDIPIWKKDAAA